MGAVLNGLALSKLRPLGSTFLTFSDYSRPAIRLSALMQLPVIYVFTHDSICVGEDGPTHQPIEQLPSLRAIPRLLVFRPADANEIVVAWRCIMEIVDRPVALVLTRQAVPTIDRNVYASAEGLKRGGYILADSRGTPEVILIGTGSEVQLCLGAAERLAREGLRARVVSLPCWQLFEAQGPEYQEDVLPPAVRARVAVEAASTFGWSRYAGIEGTIMGIGQSDFGASAPIEALLKEFGFTVERIVEAARDQVRKHTRPH
jgi:transketolase